MLSIKSRYDSAWLLPCLLLVCCSLTPTLTAADDAAPQPQVLAYLESPDLAGLDRTAVQLARHLGYELSSPKRLLQAATGIQHGLNPHGKATIYLLAQSSDVENTPAICVSLPVADYRQLLRSLGAANTEGVSQVTIAGQNLAAIQDGKFALLVDQKNENLLERLPLLIAELRLGAIHQPQRIYSVTLVMERTLTVVMREMKLLKSSFPNWKPLNLKIQMRKNRLIRGRMTNNSGTNF